MRAEAIYSIIGGIINDVAVLDSDVRGILNESVARLNYRNERRISDRPIKFLKTV